MPPLVLAERIRRVGVMVPFVSASTRRSPGYSPLGTPVYPVAVRVRRERIAEAESGVAGTPALVDIVHLFVVSPKLLNSGIAEKRRIRHVALEALTSMSSVLKFVVTGPDDVREAADVASTVGMPASRVWIMPETTSAETLGELIALVTPDAIRAGFKLQSEQRLVSSPE